MPKQTKLRIKKSGAGVEIMVLVTHPMEAGSEKNGETGQVIPADYIEKLTFALNGAVVAEARMSPGVAQDPLTVIALRQAAAGDRVAVSWRDTRGEGGTTEKVIH
ncbi:MAG TPA: thiosulfate oxidation carrier complex protein SoxZ [Gammaproteobacteria bacterium]|nr:thiosulfate oxidation carrier complex protein SoxZ [Gammaproteobacteria bacterium]